MSRLCRQPGIQREDPFYRGIRPSGNKLFIAQMTVQMGFRLNTIFIGDNLVRVNTLDVEKVT